MKCTAIIPNAVADSRLNGDKHRTGLFQMSTLEAWNNLHKTATEYPTIGIKTKIGNGSFRDKVEWNQKMRSEVNPTMETGKRKGYWLVTFNF